MQRELHVVPMYHLELEVLVCLHGQPSDIRESEVVVPNNVVPTSRNNPPVDIRELEYGPSLFRYGYPNKNLGTSTSVRVLLLETWSVWLFVNFVFIGAISCLVLARLPCYRQIPHETTKQKNKPLKTGVHHLLIWF